MKQNEAMTITEFLEARIAEDEAVAREIADCESHDPEGQGYEGTAMEMVGHKRHGVITVDPFRVLAECAAKRAIIAARTRINRSATGDEWSMGYSDANYEAIRAMTAIYADHPDYQQEWAS